MLTRDRGFAATTFVLTAATTQPADPAQPFALTALVLRCQDGRLAGTSSLRTVIDPRAPLAATAQRAGLHPDALRGHPPAAAAYAYLDAHLQHPPYLLVTHQAAAQAALIRARREICPHLAVTPVLDTAPLARHLAPDLPADALDEVTRHFGIPAAVRSGVDGAAELTCALFTHLIEQADRRGAPADLAELTRVATAPRPESVWRPAMT